MEKQSSNPLSGFFRQPVIYLKMPSLGRWWKKQSIDLPDNLELPVYAMTARDEISIRTPDALLSGQGVVDVIQSCCPNIKNAWDMPNTDVDAVLIAIRIATYGNMMEVETKCKHCGADNAHDIDLGNVLGEITCSDYTELLEVKDLKIKLKPQNYRSTNRNSRVTYDEQKVIIALENEELSDEEKLIEISKNMKKIADLGFENLVASTDYIELPDGTKVNEPEFLLEFYQNSEQMVVNEMQQLLTKMVDIQKIKPVELVCGDCTKSYSGELNFDFSNFFGKGF